MTFFNVLLAICIGAFVGKFIAMVGYYLPKILLEGCDKGKEPRDIFKWFFQKPFCLQCKHPFAGCSGLPIIGYYTLQGKCPNCTFSQRRGFILELCVAAIFGTLTLFAGVNLPLIFVLLALCLLMCCFLTDLDHMILPNQLTLALTWLGLIGSLFPVFLSPQEAIAGAVGGYGIFWLLNEIYRFFRHREGMYPGDFKLNAAIGACIGLKLLLPVLAISLMLLFVITLVRVLGAKKPQTESVLYKEVAYGCYLSAVTMVTLVLLLFGVITP